MSRFNLAIPLLIWIAGCGGAASDPGLEALLRVQGGQYVAAPLPAPAGGPAVLNLQIQSFLVRPGELARGLGGSAGDQASALAIGLRGDRGHFVVPPGNPDPLTRVLSFKVTLSFSPLLPSGGHELQVYALDEQGRAGEPAVATLQASDDAPEGKLVVSLSWANDADLDLHVVDGNGVEIWARDPSSYQNPRPGAPPDPAEVAKAGVLDFDSNSGCVIDGRRRENVIWQAAPPPGRYQVRVDAASLCGQSDSAWRVEALLDGASLGVARGIMLPNDADRFPHARGGGLQVLSFDVP